MLRTPPLTQRSGLASLGLILLALLVAGGVVFLLWTGADSLGGRRSEAAERGQRTQPVADATEVVDDERGAPPVELVPAGTNSLATQPAETVATPVVAAQVNAAGTNELALVASEGDEKVEGPALRYERGEGRTEVINGKELRRERRVDRGERQAEEAAAGIVPDKKAVQNPRKDGNRSQIEKKDSQTGKPERRPKRDAPESPRRDG